MTTGKNLPVHVIVPSEPPRLGPDWWRTKRFLLWLSTLLVVSGLATLACWLNDWSSTSFVIAGLILDIVGIVLIALPFANRSWLRVRNDLSIRRAQAAVKAYQRNQQKYKEAYEALNRQIRSGISEPTAEFPIIDNSQAEEWYEEQQLQESRLRVPDEEAAAFILGGTAFAGLGFVFQLIAQVVD